ncbi:sugar ABC transporter ATP-binding protein [Paenibacillus oralis]|uniref:Sugar ABC transporter ATP-binding protein n=1 Tax=Paenibacillus oralis TaxID=2490856 RepID=A0A3P3U3J3_9BACL|nr:sugar ABC transporter ATP-binding protein [Paenibacillus oralis]RRJ64917.1 sugar ABC transporter ATP-binding protein [Paenibacillus oralis]
MDKPVFLETRSIVKRFNEVTAVNNISMKIYRGEIRGLIGENGSGKSTISAMISGLLPKTEGDMLVEGDPYAPKDPLDARAKKIAMIVQETGTIGQLSIAENIFLGDEGRFARNGIIDRKQMHQEAKKALALVDFGEVDVSLPALTLNFEQRKLIEIARALYYEPELFIVDETTTALSHDGRLLIHRLMRKLRDQNKAVLFISHDLPELMDVCDALTVMRDGDLITTIDRSEFEENHIKQSMVGRVIEGDYYRSDIRASRGEQVMIRVNGVHASLLRDIRFELYQGEILGIGGLSGSGMHEVGKIIYGELKPDRGEVIVYGEKTPGRASGGKNRVNAENGGPLFPHKVKNVQTAIANCVGYVSKDRDRETLIMEASIKENLVLSALGKLAKFGLILPGAEKKFARRQMEELNIKASGMNQRVGELSGGNKQKVSFGKWIGNDSKILILDSPTRGVDVGVKTTMYQLLYSLKQQGYAILIISEELPELIGMSDRILVMKNGKINKEFRRDENLNESMLIDYMI